MFFPVPFCSFPGIFCIYYSYSPTSSPLGKCCWRLLGAENMGGRWWPRKTWPQWGGITGWSKTKLPTLNIFRAALCSGQWLAAPGWHPQLHSQRLRCQYHWTWYILQLNNYFWYLHLDADRTKTTKQKISGVLEEHLILWSQKGQLLSFRNSCTISFSVRSGELQRVAGESS